MRLDKYLVHWGVASRKEAGCAIRAGEVCIEGRVETQKNATVPVGAVVSYQGRTLPYREAFHYAMYKRAGVVTALKDGQHETVYDDLPPEAWRQGVRAVGRLDKDTTGLLLFTTDGDLLHRLTHPKHAMARTYLVTYEGTLPNDAEAQLLQGFAFKEGHTKPATLQRIAEGQATLTLTEGKYHEVKRLFSALSCPVIALHRTDYGAISLPDDSLPGDVWPLSDDEIEKLYQEVSFHERV